MSEKIKPKFDGMNKSYYPTQVLFPKWLREPLAREAARIGLTPNVFVRTLVMRHLDGLGVKNPLE